MKILKMILTWIWCFPQQIVGLILKVFTKAKKVDDHYVYNLKSGSISLGTYVFLCEVHKDDIMVLKHEKGHTKQSYILGWLYLIIIGLPSLIWAGCFNKYRIKHNKSYYWFYTEKWANKLAGIDID